MGGSLGNPISEAEQERINETMQEAIKIFSIEFSKVNLNYLNPLIL